jgi:hypothetical protein
LALLPACGGALAGSEEESSETEAAAAPGGIADLSEEGLESRSQSLIVRECSGTATWNEWRDVTTPCSALSSWDCSWINNCWLSNGFCTGPGGTTQPMYMTITQSCSTYPTSSCPTQLGCSLVDRCKSNCESSSVLVQCNGNQEQRVTCSNGCLGSVGQAYCAPPPPETVPGACTPNTSLCVGASGGQYGEYQICNSSGTGAIISGHCCEAGYIDCATTSFNNPWCGWIGNQQPWEADLYSACF